MNHLSYIQRPGIETKAVLFLQLIAAVGVAALLVKGAMIVAAYP
jgi:hypothetical protein